MLERPVANIRAKTFIIRYEGVVEAYYCFRVVLRGHKQLDAHQFKTDLSRWVFGRAMGKPQFGGSQASRVAPKVPYPNEGQHDTFILFDRLSDVAKFEKHFEVLGFTPTMAI